MRLLKQICSIALSAGMVLSPVASVMAAEGVTQTAAEETIESVVSENEDAVEYASGYTGLANYGGNVWHYQVNGTVQWNYTGLVQYYGTWYYVEKGTLNWNYTGLTNYYGTWYYVENGRLNWGYTGLTNYYGTWYYVEKGVLNWGYTGLTNYYGTWYYVEKGVLNWGYTSLTNYYGTWYYVEGGILNWKYTGLAKYYDTWYYIQNGVLNWNYTGYTDYYGTRYYVQNGVLVWNYSPFNLQSISAATDKFAISPMIAYYICKMYDHTQVGYSGRWDGNETKWNFIIDSGPRCATVLTLDLTTGVGQIWWNSADADSQYEGSANFVNKTSSGEKYTFGYNFFSYYVPDDIYVTRGFTWAETGSSSINDVITSMTSGLGKSCISGAVSKYGNIGKIEYLGNTGKGRVVGSLTDTSGNPFGYVVVDPVYNYFAVYNMDCVFIGEGRVDP